MDGRRDLEGPGRDGRHNRLQDELGAPLPACQQWLSTNMTAPAIVCKTAPMTDSRLEAAIAHWKPRFAGGGVFPADFERITAGLQDLSPTRSAKPPSQPRQFGLTSALRVAC